MPRKFALSVFLSALVLCGGSLMAQSYSTPLPTVNDKDVALLRQNLQAESKKIVTKNMQLSDAEAATFWPLYDEYTAEVRKVNDTRFGLIKQYAKVYKTMTAEEADSITRLLAEADQTIISLRMQYLPKFQQILPGTKAALFMQLDRRLDSLFNVQMASQLPAIKP
jgi:succinate dehydrogenase flavin-adding protein (antitoxin of CptAB toxin-antitoxin module)